MFLSPRGAFGLWRSLVAHLTGGQGVAGSNPVSPTDRRRAALSPRVRPFVVLRRGGLAGRDAVANRAVTARRPAGRCKNSRGDRKQSARYAQCCPRRPIFGRFECQCFPSSTPRNGKATRGKGHGRLHEHSQDELQELQSSKKKRSAALLAAGVIGLATAGGAYAYWTSLGGGTGTASTKAGTHERPRGHGQRHQRDVPRRHRPDGHRDGQEHRHRELHASGRSRPTSRPTSRTATAATTSSTALPAPTTTPQTPPPSP